MKKCFTVCVVLVVALTACDNRTPVQKALDEKVKALKLAQGISIDVPESWRTTSDDDKYARIVGRELGDFIVKSMNTTDCSTTPDFLKGLVTSTYKDAKVTETFALKNGSGAKYERPGSPKPEQHFFMVVSAQGKCFSVENNLFHETDYAMFEVEKRAAESIK